LLFYLIAAVVSVILGLMVAAFREIIGLLFAIKGRLYVIKNNTCLAQATESLHHEEHTEVQ
jgi:hypothetical protein